MSIFVGSNQKTPEEKKEEREHRSFTSKQAILITIFTAILSLEALINVIEKILSVLVS